MNDSADKSEPLGRVVDDVRRDEALSHEHPERAATRATGRVEIVISNLLRAGVIGSMGIILIGAIIGSIGHSELANDRAKLSPLLSVEAQFPRTARQVVAGVLKLDGGAIVVAGLLLLIVTPVMRVAVSIAAFAVQGDTTFVVITCVVFVLLILSFVFGH